MKILVVSSELPYPPHSGGGPLKLYHLLRELAADHEITLVACAEQTVRAEWLDELTGLGLDVHLHTIRDDQPSPYQDTPVVWQKYWSFEILEKLSACMRATAYDVIHLDMPPMARLCPFITHTPCVFAPNDSLTLNGRRILKQTPMWQPRFVAACTRYWILRKFEAKWYSQADVCVVVSEEEKAALAQTCPDLDVAVIPNGVDCGYFSPDTGAARDANSMVFTGTMDYTPNIDAAVWFAEDVFPAIHKANPDATFAVVGRDPVPTVTALGDIPGITVTGTVPDIRPYLNRCGVYVSPLRLGGGIKNKLMEAMAMECAIVTTTNGYAGVHADAARHMVSAESATDFAAAVVALQADANRRKTLGSNARRLMATAGWSQTASAFETIYGQLCRDRVAS